jgi:hypothetical protein
MNSTSTSTIHEEPEIGDKTARDITPAENLIFKNGWQEFGFVLAVMLGQCFNLTPFGAVTIFDGPPANFLNLVFHRRCTPDGLSLMAWVFLATMDRCPGSRLAFLSRQVASF